MTTLWGPAVGSDRKAGKPSPAGRAPATQTVREAWPDRTADPVHGLPRRRECHSGEGRSESAGCGISSAWSGCGKQMQHSPSLQLSLVFVQP